MSQSGFACHRATAIVPWAWPNFADSTPVSGVFKENSLSSTRGVPGTDGSEDLPGSQAGAVVDSQSSLCFCARRSAGRTARCTATDERWWKAAAWRPNAWFSTRCGSWARSTTVRRRPGAKQSPFRRMVPRSLGGCRCSRTTAWKACWRTFRSSGPDGPISACASHAMGCLLVGLLLLRGIAPRSVRPFASASVFAQSRG